MSRPEEDITVILRGPRDKRVMDQLYRLVEHELRQLASALMRHQNPDHTLQTTLLVDEAFIRLVSDPQRQWESRSQFFKLAFGTMKRILQDHGRRRRPGQLDEEQVPNIADARDAGPGRKLEQDETLNLIARAIDRLEQQDPEAAECFMLSFFHRLRQADEILSHAFFAEYSGKNLSLDEVARIRGKARTSTYRVLGRALDFLQAEVDRG